MNQCEKNPRFLPSKGVGQGGWGPLDLLIPENKCFPNEQSMFALVVLEGVLRPRLLAQNTKRCPCISEVLEADYKASLRALKGTVPAQKDVCEKQKSIIFPKIGVFTFPSRQNQIIHPPLHS